MNYEPIKEDYYNVRSIGDRARKDKVCKVCGVPILKGTPHDSHTFNTEEGFFISFATHINCSEIFINNLK